MVTLKLRKEYLNAVTCNIPILQLPKNRSVSLKSSVPSPNHENHRLKFDFKFKFGLEPRESNNQQQLSLHCYSKLTICSDTVTRMAQSPQTDKRHYCPAWTIYLLCFICCWKSSFVYVLCTFQSCVHSATFALGT